MIVEMSDQLVEELVVTLTAVISDMSGEIADTDNPEFRRELKARRARLRSIVAVSEPESPATRRDDSVGVRVLEGS
jgi:hypothetical protein